MKYFLSRHENIHWHLLQKKGILLTTTNAACVPYIQPDFLVVLDADAETGFRFYKNPHPLASPKTQVVEAEPGKIKVENSFADQSKKKKRFIGVEYDDCEHQPTDSFENRAEVPDASHLSEAMVCHVRMCDKSKEIASAFDLGTNWELHLYLVSSVARG